jgi:hypothetical protein
MLKKFKEAHEAKAEARQQAHATDRVGQLASEANRAFEAYTAATLENKVTRVPGIQLKKGEVAHLVLNGVGLVEPRREPGRWTGASHGVSFRIAKGVRYRVGQSRGTFVQGEEKPAVIDTGVGVITNQRLVFVGSRRSTEWAYTKLLGFSLELDGMAIFNVSNRQKASGFAYQPEVDHVVDAVVTAAIAAFQSPEDHAAVVEELLTIYREAYDAWNTASVALAGPIHELDPGR